MDTVSHQPPPSGRGTEVLPFVEMSMAQYERTPERQLLLESLRERSKAGAVKYGTTLRVHNGRLALVDAFQEAQDGMMYLGQALMERFSNERLLAFYAAVRHATSLAHLILKEEADGRAEGS